MKPITLWGILLVILRVPAPTGSLPAGLQKRWKLLLVGTTIFGWII